MITIDTKIDNFSKKGSFYINIFCCCCENIDLQSSTLINRFEWKKRTKFNMANENKYFWWLFQLSSSIIGDCFIIHKIGWLIIKLKNVIFFSLENLSNHQIAKKKKSIFLMIKWLKLSSKDIFFCKNKHKNINLRNKIIIIIINISFHFIDWLVLIEWFKVYFFQTNTFSMKFFFNLFKMNKRVNIDRMWEKCC